MEFDLMGVDAPFVNALRRIMISEVILIPHKDRFQQWQFIKLIFFKILQLSRMRYWLTD